VHTETRLSHTQLDHRHGEAEKVSNASNCESVSCVRLAIKVSISRLPWGDLNMKRGFLTNLIPWDIHDFCKCIERDHADENDFR
jgi:hypothetical protein